MAEVSNCMEGENRWVVLDVWWSVVVDMRLKVRTLYEVSEEAGSREGRVRDFFA